MNGNNILDAQAVYGYDFNLWPKISLSSCRKVPRHFISPIQPYPKNHIRRDAKNMPASNGRVIKRWK